MASWVTHLMIADRVLEAVPSLDRHGFCVGNIAPDCNVENEDWTQFIPSREVTHWMSSDKKTAADCERFYDAYIADSSYKNKSAQERSFLLGYYAHLIADAEFQRCIRDPKRVAACWARIRAHPILRAGSRGMTESWDNAKKVIGARNRMRDIHTMEAEYLDDHPDSGYLTEILGLTSFPDYLDYLPTGAITRKIGVMGYLPRRELGEYPFIAISREEYAAFLHAAVQHIIHGLTCR